MADPPVLPSTNKHQVSQFPTPQKTSTSMSNNSCAYDKVFNEPAFLFVYVVIFVLSLVLNSIVCWVVKKNPLMQTNTNYLLVNLAIADILATVLSIFHVVDYLTIDLHLGTYDTFFLAILAMQLCFLPPFFMVLRYPNHLMSHEAYNVTSIVTNQAYRFCIFLTCMNFKVKAHIDDTFFFTKKLHKSRFYDLKRVLNDFAILNCTREKKNF